MNPLRRLIQRFRGLNHDELRGRQKVGAEARQIRNGVFGRLLSLVGRRRAGRQAPGEPPRFGYSYTVFWVKMARDWEPQRRAALASALQDVLNAADFAPTATERRFNVPGLEGGPYSGASLLALNKVLAALAVDQQAGQ